MTALIAFVGDTHGNIKLMYERLLEWQERTGFEISWVWQVGDFGVWPTLESLDPSTVKHAKKHGYPLMEAFGDFHKIVLGDYEVPIPTYFTRGNHEDQRHLMTFEKQLKKDFPKDYLSRAAPICENLFYVPDSHIIQLGSKRIASWGGCWGEKTFEMEYWSKERAVENKNGFAKRLNHMTRDRFERLMRTQFDILVTHEAPAGCGVKGAHRGAASMAIDSEELTGGGALPIRQLIETVGPEYQFNGHWHEFCKSQIGQTQCMVLDKVHPGGEYKQWMEIMDIG
jgi:hypothetical protein